MEETKITYKQFIQNIINTRGQGNIPNNEYYEVHHIKPKCIGGLPLKITHTSKHENLIGLYPQEHYEAHKLLALENADNKQLEMAFTYMCFTAKTHKFLTADEYAENKIIISKSQARSGKCNRMLGKHHTDESKQAMSKAKLGKKMSKNFCVMRHDHNIKCHGGTNGEIECFCETCPGGFYAGHNNKHKTDGTGSKNPSAKICLVFDKNYKLIGEYASGADAERALELPQKTIKHHISQKKPYIGLYYFKGKE